MPIDQEKLEKASTIIIKDAILIDKQGTWASARTIRRYMGYTHSRREYQVIKQFNIPHKIYEGKKLYLLDEYLQRAPNTD